MTQPQVVLCGYYGAGNGGDEALLASMLEILPANVKPLVLSAHPQATQKCYGVAAVQRKSWQVGQVLRQSQALILGGGSLFQDVTSLQSVIYYGGLVGLARQLGLPVLAIGQGVGPLKRSSSQWIARQAFTNCTALSVRDGAAAALLESWGLQAMVAPDLVWNLTAQPLPPVVALPTPQIAVNLRRHPQLTPERFQAIGQALQELQKITQATVVVVPFQPTDGEIARSLVAMLTPGTTHLIAESDPRRLKGLFQTVHLTIGMRYHSLVMAAAEGSRCAAISYDPKVTQLAQDLDLPSCELASLPTEPEPLLQSWLNAFDRGSPLGATKVAELRQQAQLHRSLVVAALEQLG